MTAAFDRQVEDAQAVAAVVRRLAEETRSLAECERAGAAEITRLAARIEAVATDARTAVSAIEECLASASLASARSGTGELALVALELCQKWVAVLHGAFIEAVSIQSDAYSRLADWVAVDKEPGVSEARERDSG